MSNSFEYMCKYIFLSYHREPDLPSNLPACDLPTSCTGRGIYGEADLKS